MEDTQKFYKVKYTKKDGTVKEYKYPKDKFYKPKPKKPKGTKPKTDRKQIIEGIVGLGKKDISKILTYINTLKNAQ